MFTVIPEKTDSMKEAMEKNRINIGVIGVGLRGQHSYEQILKNDPRINVQAVSSYPNINPALREGQTDDDYRSYAKSLNAEYYGEDYDKLLQRNDINLISLMCEPSRALELGKEILKAGKHFLRDKPVTKTAAEAAELHLACKNVGLHGFLALPLRYHNPLKLLKQRVADENIGNILAVTMNYIWASGPLDGFTASKEYLQVYGGGDVTTAGFHAVDYLNWLIQSKPVTVYCEQDSFFYDDYKKIGMDDLGQMIITYENGTVATLLTGRVPSRCGRASWIDVTGEEGAIELSDLFPSVRIEAESIRRVVFDHDPLGNLCQDVVDAIVNNKAAPADISDGAWSLAVLEASRESAQTHAAIAVTNPFEQGRTQ